VKTLPPASGVMGNEVVSVGFCLVGSLVQASKGFPASSYRTFLLRCECVQGIVVAVAVVACFALMRASQPADVQIHLVSGDN